MHEIFIAESIVQIVEAAAHKQSSRSVQLVKVRLGQFTTIVREALEFAFEMARQGTVAEHAVLEIEVVPTVVACVVCDAVTTPEIALSFICARCGFPLKVVSGEELQIEYIELETETERKAWNESLCKQMC